MSAAPRLRVVLMRGGTSKGVFVREGDLPAAGPDRDRLLLRLMGSPDPMQLDGLGGSHSSTSKVMAVSQSDRPCTDVEYLFAQVGIDRAHVDYRGNCGNLTTAVGAYAIDAAARERGNASVARATVLVAHPKGAAAATVRIDGAAVHSVSITRTARRLLAGEAYL